MADDQKPQDPVLPADDSAVSNNRPDSTISADSRITSADSSQVSADSVSQPPSDQSAGNLAETPVSTPSASPVTDTNRPEPTVSADSSQVSADSTVSPANSNLSVETKEEEVEKPAESQPPDQEPSPPSPIPDLSSLSDSSDISGSSSVPPIESAPPQVGQSSPSEATKPPEEKVDTDISSIDQQATQVQQEAPKDTSTIDTVQSENQSAEIKPEPLESPQDAPLANNNISESVNTTPSSPSITFGDLLSAESQPSSSPDLSSLSSPSDLPVSSFPNPQPTTHNSQPTTYNPQLTTYNPQPISFSSQLDQLSLHRQKANKVRQQKKQNHLNKIMELARNTKTITNTDIQRLLHVSQSTATNYLSELVNKGLLKREGIRGGTRYKI